VTLYNSSFQNIQENYINIITRTSDTLNVTFDGQPMTSLNGDIILAGKNNEFASITIRVNTGAHTIASAGCGVIAKAYGLGVYESYAYSGGASFNKINASPIPDGGCLNDTVFFDTGLPEERFAVQWIFEGGDTILEHQFTRFYDALGTYPAELFIHDMCFDLFDTLSQDLMITLRQSVAADPVNLVCEGSDIALFATDVEDATYRWTGPLDYFSEEQDPVIADVSPDMSGVYEVIGIVSGCATFPATIDIEVSPSPSPNLGADQVLCPKSEEGTSISPGDYLSYQWADGSTSGSRIVHEEGLYVVTVTDEFNCTSTDSIFLTQQCPTVTYVPNIFSPNGDQVNDLFGVLGEDIISIDFSIYNRWGERVFLTRDLDKMWDGTHQGRAAQQGVYAWVLVLQGYEEDGSTFERLSKGTVTIIR